MPSRSSRGSGHRYPASTRRRALRLFGQYQWPQTKIARHLDVPVDTVRRWLRAVNPLDGNTRRYDRAKIIAEHEGGATRQTLRERHGCSERFLSDLLSGKLTP